MLHPPICTPDYYPFCTSCEQESRPFISRQQTRFSEAKEEELDCQYCKQKNLHRPAETLFNGLPSCRECKKKQAVNIIARNSINQKIVLTQVNCSRDGDLIPTIRSPTAFTSLEGDFFTKAVKAARYDALNDENCCPNLDTASSNRDSVGHGLSLHDVTSVQSKQPSRSTRNGKSSIVLSSWNSNLETSGNPLRASMSSTCSSITTPSDFSQIVKEVNTSVKKARASAQPDRKISEPQVLQFFKTLKKIGSRAMKKQLLYSMIPGKPSEKPYLSKCQNQSPLLFLIQLQSGICFGAFISKPLSSKAAELKDKKAVLFSTQDISRVSFYRVHTDHICYTSNCISFGNPMISEIHLEEASSMICNLEIPYKSPCGDVCLWRIDQEPNWHKQIKEVSIYSLS